jgi:hypothetical protein
MRTGILGLPRRERLLFTTHQPPFRVPEWEVGRVVAHRGRLYRVSRWVELRPVTLERGGSVGQWEVWGRRITDRQIRREVVDAAEAILQGEPAAKE